MIDLLKGKICTKNPIDWIKKYRQRRKWMKQRLSRGWADCDVCNANTFIAEICEGILLHLSDAPVGYDDNEFSSAQEYSITLIEIANHFKESNTWNVDSKNIFLEEIEKFHSENPETEIPEDLKKAYLAENQRLLNVANWHKNSALDGLKKCWYSLWD